MSATVSGFGRRRVEDVAPKPPPPPAAPEPVAKAAPATPAALAQVAAMAQLRALCLAQLDAATLAGLSPEKLAHEIERTLAAIATERRMQLNGREQRELAIELVDDMLGLGPLQPLLDDARLREYAPLQAVRGELLLQLGRQDDARAAFAAAAALRVNLR